jgi:ATP-dependent helicase/nuclease subunit B
LVIGATSDAAAETCRLVSRGLGGMFGWHQMTVAQLAWAIAGTRLAEKGLTPVGGLALEALCARLVHAAREAGTLGFLAPIGDRPGLARALARTLTDLRMAAVSPSAITNPDLSRLMASYEEELARRGLADRSLLLERAVAAVEEGATALAGLPLLMLDVPVWTKRELGFVTALVTRASDCLITVPAGDDRTLHSLGTIAANIVHDTSNGDVPVRRLQRGLFEGVEAHGPSDDAVAVFSAPGESRECVEIARRIHEEAGRGTPFDQMAVLLRAPAQYAGHLEEALRRAGVPAYFARGCSRPDPAGRAFLALLASAQEGLSAARFAEYLSVGEVPDAAEGGTPPPSTPSQDRWVPPDEELAPNREPETAADPEAPPPAHDKPVYDGTLRTPRQWEKLLVEAAVIGGIDRWRRRLDGLRAQLEMGFEEGADPGSPAMLGRRRDLEALANLQAYALPLLEDLASLPATAAWGTWLDRLGALATRSLRHSTRVLAVLADLAPMADVGPVDLAEVRLVLERRLTELAQPPPRTRYGRVFVGSTDDARAMSFEVVFAPGLSERLFPQKIAEDPILPDAQRAVIDAALTTNADRSVSERLALRLAIGAATRRVVASYPRLELEPTRPRTPSFYALELVRAAEGKLPGFEELARKADVTGAARIGWPAPTTPEQAIDHAEHDLALLESILRRPAGETVGAARYLLSANAHLARSLRFRARRWRKAWSEADGLVRLGEASREAIAPHHLSARAYSPTALEAFASCPYRFVLQAIHRLSVREEPAPLEDLDPLQRGSLIHQIQFQTMTELRARKLLPLAANELAAARACLDEVVDAVAAEMKEELAPAIERVWTDSIAAIRADAHEWLRRAAEDADWRPAHFELSFGLPRDASRDPNSAEDPVKLACGLQLRGSIDLVEQEKASRRLRATDYKTGKAWVKEGTVVQGGEVLQPVLYALALEKLFSGAAVDGARLYYCTSVGGFQEVSVPLEDAARQSAQVLADTVAGSISSGFLPAAPRKGACERCDYAHVCGPYEELRTGRKRREELAPLIKLRDLP